eukprot:Em0015g584a
MAARPLVMPEIFNGDSSWDQWIYHFENVAVVNDWDEDASLPKLRLKVVESLRTLVDKAYPDLEDNAKEQLALNHFVSQIENCQVAFSVRQKRPKTVDEAVSATLEMEAYIDAKTISSVVEVEDVTTDPLAVNGVTSSMANLMKQCIDRLEKLEMKLVGVDGSELRVCGYVKLALKIGTASVSTPVVVVDTLTAEGILGMDLLRHHQCNINIPDNSLTLSQLGITVPLQTPTTKTYSVSLIDNIHIPPSNYMKARCMLVQSHLQKPLQLDPAQPASVSGEKQKILKQLLDASGSTLLTEDQKEAFKSLVLQYADIFFCREDNLGRTSKLCHSIDTGSAPPIRQHVRRIPPAQRTLVKDLLDDMLHKDIIQPSQSPWASPIVLARKKDGSVRFCADYRKVNEVTRKDAYPLPRINDTLETLSDSKIFSTLDLASGYWQVVLTENDRQKTAFCTTEGLYEFKVMPFGLCNAPATFQRLMDIVLTECQKSFEILCHLLSSPPILSYPDFTKPFILDTDASNDGIGGVLSQLDKDGREHVVAYGSRLLTKPERNYCVTRKELLAVVTFVTHFRTYLLGHTFTLRTDHGPLTWLYSMKEPEGQVARWLEKLQEYNFEIVHRKGLRHINADALSRLPCHQCGLNEEVIQEEGSSVAVVQLSGLCAEEILNNQREDQDLKTIIEAKMTQTRPPNPKPKTGQCLEQRRLLQLWDHLLLRNGLLYRKCIDRKHPSRVQYQLVVPPKLRSQVLKEIHEGAMGGHLGEEKTLQKLKDRFYWPGHWKSVQEWCRTCPACSQRKTPTSKNLALLQSVAVSSPMQMVAIDILGPLPVTLAGNKYILVAADYFSKWIEAYAIPNQEATTIARKLLDEMFCRFALPEKLHSDQGRQFEAEVTTQLCQFLQIEKTRTTPYHPQSDGLVERFNRTLLNMLSTCSMEHPSDWDLYLSKLCLAYNSSVQSTTGYSPFFLMFGREARLPIDLIYNLNRDQEGTADKSYSTYVNKQREQFAEAYEKFQMDTHPLLNPMEDTQLEHGDLLIDFKVEYVDVFSVEGDICNATNGQYLKC